QPGFEITVTREGTRMFAQATGQGRFEIFAQSETRFFLREIAAQLEFEVGRVGPAEAFTLFQGGQERRAVRVGGAEDARKS
ncbi:MAG: DUF3471 domain-containing protein, partial [Gemmatimonadota bacterium]